MRTTTVFVALALLMTGCATDMYGRNEQAGMIIGGALGGMLGSEVGQGRGRTAAIIIGTLAGSAIGGAVGRSMDETDRMKTAMTLESVRTGVTSTWRNPDTATEYAVTPTRTVESPAGPCRDFTMEALIGGEHETVYGTACREPDGTWTMR
jgi:surface antigen